MSTYAAILVLLKLFLMCPNDANTLKIRKVGNEDFWTFASCLLLFLYSVDCCMSHSILWLNVELLNNSRIMKQLIGVTYQFPIESTTQNCAQIDKENDTLLDCIMSTNHKYQYLFK